jgi:cell wall-associated NlpC family hydrolase
MYIGNGQMVHAGSSGDVVKVVDLAYMPGITAARRLV